MSVTNSSSEFTTMIVITGHQILFPKKGCSDRSPAVTRTFFPRHVPCAQRSTCTCRSLATFSRGGGFHRSPVTFSRGLFWARTGHLPVCDIFPMQACFLRTQVTYYDVFPKCVLCAQATSPFSSASSSVCTRALRTICDRQHR